MTMNTLIQTAEELLAELAQQHTPEGTDSQAILDQWFHAIATHSQFYCNKEIDTPKNLKSKVVNLLKEHNIYQSDKQFFNLVFGNLKIKPQKKTNFKFIDLFAGIGGIRLCVQEN